MFLAVTFERRFLAAQTFHTHQQLRSSCACDMERGKACSFVALYTSPVFDLAQRAGLCNHQLI